jgi:hypothetical protein
LRLLWHLQLWICIKMKVSYVSKYRFPYDIYGLVIV